MYVLLISFPLLFCGGIYRVRKEGIFVGITSGATLAAALEIAKTAPKGSNILVMLADTGERYMTTALFDNVEEDMNEEELNISRSSPNYRFDVANPAPPPPTEPETPVELDPAVVLQVEKLISDTNEPIVMFGMEWCEFCWSVRKMLDKYEIPFISVDIDSVKYDKDNVGQKIREVIRDKTTWNTFPQIFIGGQHIGGSDDLEKYFA